MCWTSYSMYGGCRLNTHGGPRHGLQSLTIWSEIKKKGSYLRSTALPGGVPEGGSSPLGSVRGDGNAEARIRHRCCGLGSDGASLLPLAVTVVLRVAHGLLGAQGLTCCAPALSAPGNLLQVRPTQRARARTHPWVRILYACVMSSQYSVATSTCGSRRAEIHQ